MTVVRIVTTSSTNITGFFISVRGFSFTKAELIAGTTIFGSNSAETGMRLRGVVEVSIEAHSESICRERRAGDPREMPKERSERERGEEGQAADDQDHPDGQADEQAARRREGAGGWRHDLL